LGGQILGYAATELIAEVALAVKNSLKAEDVAETVQAIPRWRKALWKLRMASTVSLCISCKKGTAQFAYQLGNSFWAISYRT
jgi:hypothetical protein